MRTIILIHGEPSVENLGDATPDDKAKRGRLMRRSTKAHRLSEVQGVGRGKTTGKFVEVMSPKLLNFLRDGAVANPDNGRVAPVNNPQPPIGGGIVPLPTPDQYLRAAMAARSAKGRVKI
jgi:hypothetical protein